MRRSSLEPAVAALVAAVLLREWLTPLALLAIACVTAASVGAARTTPQTDDRASDPGDLD